MSRERGIYGTETDSSHGPEKRSFDHEKAEVIKEKYLAVLISEGFVERRDDGVLIVDFAELHSHIKKRQYYRYNSFNDLKDGLINNGNKYTSFLSTIFKGEKCITEQEYDAEIDSGNEAIPSQIIYDPEPQDALSMDAIKSSDFKYGAWEVDKNFFLTSDYTKPLNESEPNFFEKSIAVIIYHPRFGNGYRNEAGELMVYWPKYKKYRKISGDWFEGGRNFGGHNVKDNRGNIANSPHIFLNTYAPKLIESGLLRTSDFGMLAGTKSAERHRIDIKVGKSGFVTFNKVMYFIGKTKEFEGARAIQLTDDTIGIVTTDPLGGDRKLSHTFQLLNPKVSGLSTFRTKGKEYHYATKRQTNLQVADSKDLERYQSESDEDFGRRASMVQNADFLLGLSDRLSHEAGVNISLLEFAEQRTIADSINRIKKDPQAILDFAKRYGADGLRALITMDYGEDMGEKVLRIAEDIDEETGKSIFSKYSKILDTVKEISGYINENLGGSEKSYDLEKTIEEKLLERGKELISRFADKLAEGKSGQETDKEVLLNELNVINEDNELFLAVVRSIPKERRAETLQHMSDVSMELVRGDELSKDDIEQMRSIYERNYSESRYKKLRENLLISFEESISDKKKSPRFYLTRHKGEVKAFCRFTDTSESSSAQERRLFFGAFNVDRTFRGSGIGEAMMMESLDKESESNVIDADCDALSDISMNYIERGFVADRFYEKDGIPSLHIVRNESKNYDYALKRTKQDVVVNTFKKNAGRTRSGSDSQSVTTKSDEQIIRSKSKTSIPFDKYLVGKKRMTRYFTSGEYVYAVFEDEK